MLGECLGCSGGSWRDGGLSVRMGSREVGDEEMYSVVDSIVWHVTLCVLLFEVSGKHR